MIIIVSVYICYLVILNIGLWFPCLLSINHYKSWNKSSHIYKCIGSALCIYPNSDCRSFKSYYILVHYALWWFHEYMCLTSGLSYLRLGNSYLITIWDIDLQRMANCPNFVQVHDCRKRLCNKSGIFKSAMFVGACDN
jgi:hypothetical protein